MSTHREIPHLATNTAKNDSSVSSEDENQPLLHSKKHSSPSLSASLSTSDSDSDLTNPKHQIRASWRTWTRAQWIILITHCSLLFCGSIGYSLLAAFFPQEASKKGADPLVIGLIFGVYELVVFMMSPVFGSLISKVTPRWMCLSGSIISGGCTILFGLLQWCPDGVPFLFMCFLIRIVNALGASMAVVSNYAILSIAFPDHIAIVNSIAGMPVGLGFTLGPVVGGILYDSGGFIMPFSVVGGISLVATIAAFFEPVIHGDGEESSLKFYTLLSNTGIALICVHYVGASLSMTYLDPILSQWLQDTFSISVTVVGLVFLIWSGVYTLLSPVIGKLTDKGYVYSIMFAGGLLQCISFLLLGPSPLLKSFIPNKLWVACVACGLAGLANTAAFIPVYVAAINLVIVDGYTMDTRVYGMISALIASSNSLGALAGPVIAGFLESRLGFAWSITVCAFIVLVTSTPIAVYCTVRSMRGLKLSPYQEIDSKHININDNNNAAAT